MKPEELEALREAHGRETDARIAARLQAVHMVCSMKKSAQETAEALMWDVQSVELWVRRYEKGGIDALRTVPATPANLRRMSPARLGELVRELFGAMGCTVDSVLEGRNFGIDLWATRDDTITGIKMDYSSKHIDYKECAQVLGSNLYRAKHYVVISVRSPFTSGALEHQRLHPKMIELWDGDRLAEKLDRYSVGVPAPAAGTPHDGGGSGLVVSDGGDGLDDGAGIRPTCPTCNRPPESCHC